MKSLIAALILLVQLPSYAQDAVKPHMQDFYLSVKQISSYLIDKKEYMDEKNDKEISQALTDFNSKIIQLKQEKLANSDDMKFRYKLLSDGLADAEQSFKTGSKDYSFWVLKSSLNNCYACHTQKGLGDTNYKFEFSKKYDEYSQAEFLFLVRNYSDAEKIFANLILRYPSNKLSIENLENSIQRLLYYNVRVLKNDKKTLALFTQLSRNTKLPSSVRNELLAWKKYLSTKKYRLVSESQIKTAKNLENFVAERTKVASRYKLPNQRYIVDLETSTLLFQLLANPEKKELKPWVLYWLSMQEKDYRLSLFDNSVDNYLKECMERYPQHPAAVQCFKLYKELITDSFTGSRGVSIPAAVNDQILKYEKMVTAK